MNFCRKTCPVKCCLFKVFQNEYIGESFYGYLSCGDSYLDRNFYSQKEIVECLPEKYKIKELMLNLKTGDVDAYPVQIKGKNKVKNIWKIIKKTINKVDCPYKFEREIYEV